MEKEKLDLAKETEETRKREKVQELFRTNRRDKLESDASKAAVAASLATTRLLIALTEKLTGVKNKKKKKKSAAGGGAAGGGAAPPAASGGAAA